MTTYYHQTSSSELRERMRTEHGERHLLSFSRGKDSIATLAAMIDSGFDVYPYFYYVVPDLEFVEEDLQRWERILDRHIVRLPAPGLYRMLSANVYQPPQNVTINEASKWPIFDHDDLQAAAAEDHGLVDPWNGLGVRGKDSPARGYEIIKHGPVREKRRIWYPIFDWSKADVIAAITARGWKLPKEYRYFPASFDGIYARYLVPMKKHFPRDYARVLEFFPLAELEVWRYESYAK